MNRNIPTLDEETTTAIRKLEAERQNNEAFFNERTYIDTGETVGDKAFWSVKIISMDSPFERAQGYTFYFAVDNLEDFPMDALDDREISEIHLDRAVPDDEGDARFKIIETNDFMFLDELEDYISEVDNE